MDKVRGVKRDPNGKPVLGHFGSFKEIKGVILCRRGEQFTGEFFLAEHHIVFSWAAATEAGAKPRSRQIWIPYPLISHCTFKSEPASVRLRPSIRLRCRDFTFIAFQFPDEAEAREVFDAVKSLTCLNNSLEKLHAFSYRPPAEELREDGWSVYDAKKEFARQGVVTQDKGKGLQKPDSGWRVSDINQDYSYSPTYPAVLVVPTSISDNVLKHGGPYRSKSRIPALTYLHRNGCSITRSSQPLVGLFKGKRNVQDEALVQAIFSLEAGDKLDADADDTPAVLTEPVLQSPKVYHAHQRNLIIDARPLMNARANQVGGMGSENMEYYKDATIEFLGIDNIHVMRDSLAKVIEALQHSDYTNLPPDQDLLARSKWLKYIGLVVRGADLVARQIAFNHSHVLIHCSDGWDRTSQISSLAQLCLDPYYRTLEGFIVLIEKDWLSFGHMFRRRTGPLSSEKWFEMDVDRNRRDSSNAHNSTSGTNAFESALFTARGFFNKKNDSRENLASDPEGVDTPSRASKHDPFATKPSETSPIFHQFLDATWQYLRQHPTRFEFNERFLRRLLYQLYSAQYGTFLFDSECERRKHHTTTRSVWDHFLSRREQWLNPSYPGWAHESALAEEDKLLFPDPAKMRWWADLFGRTDEEMNGTPAMPSASLPQADEPVVTGVESTDVATGTADPWSMEKLSGSIKAAVSNGVAKVGTPKGTPERREYSSPRRDYGSPRREYASPVRRERPAETKPVEDGIPAPPRKSEIDYSSFARGSAFRDA